MKRLRILPLLILVSMLSFTVRIGEFWTGMASAGSASAQEEVKAEPPPLPSKKSETAAEAAKPEGKEEKPAEKTEAKADEAKDGPALPAEGSGEKVEWRDATEEDFSCTDTQEQLSKDLAKRREQLDKQDSELAARKALLDAAQKELDQKIGEVTNLRNEIKGMMDQLSTEEKQRIGALVKIYEGMKPADAARIFNTLDMDVLLQVMSQMSTRKTSPILAAMESERAKTVTIMLAQQKKLPEMPSESN